MSKTRLVAVSSALGRTLSEETIAPLLLCRRACRGEKERREMLNWASIINALYIITHLGHNGRSISRSGKINV